MAINNILVSPTDYTLITVPANSSYAVTTVMICNTYTANPADPLEGSVTFDLHIVPVGQALQPKNRVVSKFVLPAGETFTINSERIVLSAGDYVVVNCDYPGTPDPYYVSATISYLEV
jgi:hypothetical protein